MQPRSKVLYLEGLRGVAAFCVVLHHGACLFFPAAVFGYFERAHYPFEYVIWSTPLNLLIDGHFAVCIFFVLSGYVLSRKFFVTGDREVIISLAVRRYLRLLLPVLGSVLIAYLALVAGLLAVKGAVPFTHSDQWLAFEWQFAPSLLHALYQGFIGVFVTNPANYAAYNSSLWTMYYEFFGSFGLFASLAILGKERVRFLVYGVLCLLLWHSLFICFVFGVVLADVAKPTVHLTPTIGWLLLLMGLLFGSYPLADAVDTPYHFLMISWLSPNTLVTVYHSLGALLVVGALMLLPRAQAVLSRPLARWLGSISFSLYVLHIMILCAVSLPLALWLAPLVGYGSAATVALFVGVATSLVIAQVYTRYVDTTSIRASDALWRRVHSWSKRHVAAQKVTR